MPLPGNPSAPPVYKPNAPAPPKTAPPVYSTVAPLQAKMTAPPVFRSVALVQAKLAPPVYRPTNIRSVQRITAPTAYRPIPGIQRLSTPASLRQTSLVIQGTLRQAKAYAQKNQYFDMEIIRSKEDIERILNKTDVPINERAALLDKYNNGLNEDEKINLELQESSAPAPPQPIITDSNFGDYWTKGKYSSGRENATEHFAKHITNKKEFQNKYHSVAEYTQGANKLAQSNALEGSQLKGNWGKYKYDKDKGRGKMVVLNGEDGKIASFYELNKGTNETADYLKRKLGLSSASEVLELLKQQRDGKRRKTDTSATSPNTEAPSWGGQAPNSTIPFQNWGTNHPLHRKRDDDDDSLAP
jgi:hypothetical protein